ncbi:S1C family serine protease [uncultured Sphingomonas sp.]|uniref:S1C family serine protease n=1 Tax=uncultured Sphingomonas sp. TaxID=158754 RepID=UPI0035CBAC70
MTARFSIGSVTRRLAALVALAVGVMMPIAAGADDIAAAARSVVRVVTIAVVDQEVVGFYHGSGFAVGPNRIVTNAHVVELAEQYPDNVVIGIVPSEGTKSYQARVVAIDTRRDLALIEFTGVSLPPVALFSGSIDDSLALTSLGYPGNVDLATARSAADFITPLAPVRSEGSLSARRTRNGVEALLHTASISRGNSGGPLLDRCGRVIGVNSAITRGEEGDANFAFAIADSEVIAFLRDAKQPFTSTAMPCMSVAERMSADQAADAAANQAAAAARRDAAAKAQFDRQQALDRVRIDLERTDQNIIAIAALLLVLGALTVGGGGVLLTRGRQQPAAWTASAGAVLMVAAIIVFLNRPSGIAVLPPGFVVPGATPTAIADQPRGKMACKLVPERSRITVSSEEPVLLDWGSGGCVNGRTQYAEEDGRWTRVLVPDKDQTVSVLTFDPLARTFTSLRYFLNGTQMDAARKVRAQIALKQCSADPKALDSLATQQQSIRGTLPPEYSEKLVYSCAPAD